MRQHKSGAALFLTVGQNKKRKRRDAGISPRTAKIKLRATKRIGQLSKELEKAPRGGTHNGKHGSIKLPTAGKNEILKAAGISQTAAYRCEAVADVPDKEFEDYIETQRRLGEMLNVTPMNRGASAGGEKDSPRGSYLELRDSTPTLAELGIDKKISSLAHGKDITDQAGRRKMAFRL